MSHLLLLLLIEGITFCVASSDTKGVLKARIIDGFCSEKFMSLIFFDAASFSWACGTKPLPQQLLAQLVDSLFNLCSRHALLLKVILQLDTLNFHFSLSFVIQDGRVRSTVLDDSIALAV